MYLTRIGSQMKDTGTKGHIFIVISIFVRTQKIPPQPPQNGLGCRCTKGLRVGRYLFETSPETSPKSEKPPKVTKTKTITKTICLGKLIGGISGEV